MRPEADLSDVGEVTRKARARLDGQLHGAAPAPYRALDLIEGAADVVARGGLPRRGGRARRAPPRPAGAGVRLRLQPDRAPRRNVESAFPTSSRRRIRKVGIVGAGLMARQLALLALRRLEVPIVLRDLDARTGGRSGRVDRERARRARAEGSARRGQGALPRLIGHRRNGLGGLRRLGSRPRGGLRGDGA